MNYKGTRLKEEITISELVSLHYYEFDKDYNFPGESHNWWEFVYVDKGELTAVSEDVHTILSQGEIIFHKPNEWHSLTANGINASSALVISFKSTSGAMKNFENKIFMTGNTHRKLLSLIMEESKKAFDSPLSDLFTPKLHRRQNSQFGCEQLIKMYLCELLIALVRNDSLPPVNTIKKNLDDGLFAEIIAFMDSNIASKLSLDDIAHFAGISKTAVKQLFREQAGCGACEYYIRMKIDLAKKYIRERSYNFTQIAEILGYDSIHYFSRQFKQCVNMSPSEYAASVKALSDKAASYSSTENNT